MAHVGGKDYVGAGAVLNYGGGAAPVSSAAAAPASSAVSDAAAQSSWQPYLSNSTALQATLNSTRNDSRGR
jgi:hypothetical protein